VPPFGANGIAFNNGHTAMFVANTGNDTVVKIPVLSGFTVGTPEVFVNSINGADGLIIDASDNIWVAANQADELVVVDPSGRAIAKLGDFEGIDEHGTPAGLLFPASLVFSNGFVYVTNLSLDLRLFGSATVDSQWRPRSRATTSPAFARRFHRCAKDRERKARIESKQPPAGNGGTPCKSPASPGFLHWRCIKSRGRSGQVTVKKYRFEGPGDLSSTGGQFALPQRPSQLVGNKAM
jgi:hypothetical protein